MESNNPIIVKCLDDLVMGNISKEEAAEVFSQHNIAEPEQMIERHQMAVAVVQRYALQQQVNQIHRSFMADKALTSPERLQQTDSSQPISSKLVKMPVRKIVWRAAAAVTIVCVFSLSYLMLGNNSTKMYNELNTAYNVTVDRGNAAGNDNQENLVALYQQNKFEEVLKLYHQTKPSGNRDKFLAAMSATQLSKHAAAVQILQTLLAGNQLTGSRLYNDHAEYYLMLNLLQQKQHSYALDIAKKINTDSFHIYHEKISDWIIFKMKWMR